MKTRLFSELATLRRLGSRTWLNGIARDRPILVADLNLRPPFNDVDTVTRALSAADVLKVNEEELDFLAATFRVAQPVKWVFSHFNTQLIAVTRGEKGASLFGRTVEAHVAGHRVCGGDPVGAGDAFVASLSLSLVNRNSIVRCLEDANRYAAWVASQRGGMPQVSTQAPA
jgi:fructokinase